MQASRSMSEIPYQQTLNLSGVDNARSGRPVLGAARSDSLRDMGREDVEKGLCNDEHVILKFEGSSCPGCTSKLSKALSSIPHVYNLQLNNILLQAEFDINLAEISSHNVIESIRGTTGRNCRRIGEGWKEIDIVAPDMDSKFMDALLPSGVKDVIRLSKNNYTIKYDPRAIGARLILAVLIKRLEIPVRLAPAEHLNAIPSDIRTTAYSTALSSILTVPILILAWAPLPEHKITYGAIALALATTIQVVVAGPFYPRTLRNLILTRRIDMDLLIVLSTSIAYGFSVASFFCEVNGTELQSGVHFETSALLMTFIMLGRLISDFACHRSMKSKSFKSLQPQNALLVESSDLDTDDEIEIDARLLQYGDCFKVKPGCSVVTDGTIISGVSEFDESIMTGEAAMKQRKIGSSVIAGSVNRSNTVLVQLARLPGDNTIDKIATKVEEVTRSRLKTQEIADRVAGWMVPAIGVLAVLTLLIWFVAGRISHKDSNGSAILNAIPYAISVLIVSCPCAVGLAVPMVLLVASSIGAKHGVMFGSAGAISTAKDVTHVVVDKTGTLTESNLSVVSEEYYVESRSLTASLVLALASHSEHPVSSAVTRHLKVSDFEPANVTDYTTTIGKGIEATWNGRVVRIGNPRWLGVESSSLVQSILNRSLTAMCVVLEDQLVAAYGLESTLRHDASSVISRLIQRGVSLSILSGDEVGAVQQVATLLGIPHENIRARCTPLEKQQHVKALMEDKKDTVLFCGDGFNDAAAIAQASLGLHMTNDDTSVQHDTGDAVLNSPSLSGILVLMDLSRDCCRQITFNFIWAAFYNLFAILLAAGAFVKIRLPPEYAGLGEAVSVLPVILVPLRLRWKRYA